MRVGPILTAKYITSSLLKVSLRDVMSSIWLQQSIVLIGMTREIIIIVYIY